MEVAASDEPKLATETASANVIEGDDSKHGGWITFPFIIGTVVGLTLAAGGCIANLIVFLIKEFNVNSIKAAQIFNVVMGSSSLFPIAAAVFSDSFSGSFPTIAFFSIVSLLGTILLTLTVSLHSLRPLPCTNGSNTCEAPSRLQYGVLYAVLALISIGQGGTRFLIATMGADQFKKPKDQGIFFNWYFVALYMASVTCFTAMVYVEDNIGWGVGFGICVAANAIGLVLFLSGRPVYRHMTPKGSPFTSLARVIFAALEKRKLSGSSESRDYYQGSTLLGAPSKSLRFLNPAALKTRGDIGSDGSYARSWRLCTVEEVEDFKALIKMIPIWSTSIFLSTPIGVATSLVVLQAITMDKSLGPHFNIPPSSFLVFNLLATAISITFIDRCFLPCWLKLAHQPLRSLQRIGIGHIFNILAMVGFALVEVRRLHLVRSHQLTHNSGALVPMSALWLVLPLAVMGIGEGFHFPEQVALYYREFPESLRSSSTAMISLLIAAGFYLSTAMIDLMGRITRWLPDNINEGRLDNVFWTLAVMGAVNFGYFLICAMLFKYKNVEKDKPNGPAI